MAPPPRASAVSRPRPTPAPCGGCHARVGEPVVLDRGARPERASVEAGLARVLGGQAVVLEVAEVLVDGLAGDAQLVRDGGRILALVEPLEDALLGVGRLGDRARPITLWSDGNPWLTSASTCPAAGAASRQGAGVDIGVDVPPAGSRSGIDGEGSNRPFRATVSPTTGDSTRCLSTSLGRREGSSRRSVSWMRSCRALCWVG